MAKYEVILNGVNYLLPIYGEFVEDEINEVSIKKIDDVCKSNYSPRKVGFYVTRYVEAIDPDFAERLAIELIQNSKKLNSLILNSDDDPPVIYLEEMYQVDSFPDIETLEPGFGFYLED